MSILVLLVLLPSTLSENITAEENKYLKDHCGKHFLKDPLRNSASIIGGIKAKQNEFPWIVGLYFKKAIYKPPYWVPLVRGCSGVQVSKRHVLTAAHCMVTNSPYLDRYCKKGSTVRNRDKYSVEQPGLFTVFVGSDCTNPELCWKNRTNYSVVGITVNEDYNPCNLDSDLALVEINPDISEKHGYPVCMPVPNQTLPSKMTAVGFGIDTAHPPKEGAVLSDLQSVELTKIFGGPPKTITMGAFDKSVCNGDSGGPLVRIDKDIYTVTGIAIAVIPSCSTRDSRSDGFIRDGPLRKAKLDTEAKPPNRDEQQARTIDSDHRL
uniref:Peptidase S1 domain-containing protein n=1 Tax=Angiostrongylus cantonensis TaxID=6313 RepID=A0A0K0DHP0_ANGCA